MRIAALLLLPCCYCLAATALLLLLAAIACCYCLLLCSQRGTLETYKAKSQAKKGFVKHGDKHPTLKASVADQRGITTAKAKRATGGKKGVVANKICFHSHYGGGNANCPDALLDLHSPKTNKQANCLLV